MIFVVFVHIHFYFDCDYFGETCLKSFYLPLFFMLSGLFFKSYSGTREFIIRKVNSILVPFVFFYVITSVLLTWCLSFIRGKNIDWSLLWAFVVPEHYPNLPIWFLICLFIQCILFYLLYRLYVNKVYVMALLVFLFGILGIYCRKIGLDLPMQIDSAMSAMPFFFIGWCISKYGLLKKLDVSNCRLVLWAISFIALAYLFCADVNYQKNMFCSNFFCVYLSGIFGCFFVICFSKLIRKIRFIRYIGNNSLIVLCTHQLVLQVTLPIVKRMELGNWMTIFLTLVIVLSCYIIIVPIMKQFLPIFIGQKKLFKI